MRSPGRPYTRMSKRQTWAAALLGIYGAAVLWVTVFSRDTLQKDPLLFQPFHSFLSIMEQGFSAGPARDLIGNVLLFLPVGCLFPPAFQRGWKATLLFGLCACLLVETLQLALHKGFFEIDDMITNTAGAGLGYLIYRLLTAILRRKKVGEV